MKLMTVRLEGIHVEGERVRVRFVDVEKRQNIVDVLMDDAPSIKVRGTFELHLLEEASPAPATAAEPAPASA